MKKYIFLIFFIFQPVFSQVKQEISNIFGAKSYSKEISLFRGKEFLIKEVLGSSTEVTRFELDPMEAAPSGELTTLYYNCESLKKEGVIFGFYGDYANEFGILLQGYAYKNFNKQQSSELFQKIEEAKIKNAQYLNDDIDNHNIYITFEDLTLLIYRKEQYFRYRVFWKSFDSEWGDFAFRRTKSKFEKKVK